VWLCAAWLLPACMLLYAYYGTVYATIQDIIEPSLRGTAMAIYFCAMYFLGALLGPVATGWVSDFFARRVARVEPVTELHKAVGLHDAMYLIPALNAALVVVLFAASRTVRRDYQRCQERMEAATKAADLARVWAASGGTWGDTMSRTDRGAPAEPGITESSPNPCPVRPAPGDQIEGGTPPSGP